MKKFRLGLSLCGRPFAEEEFEQYSKAGIKSMEISLGDETLENFDWTTLQQRARKFDIELWTFHLPFLPFAELDPASENEEKREHTVKYLSEIIKKAGCAGIKNFVIHPSAEPIEEDKREEALKCSADTLTKLADVAEPFDGFIIVENLPRTCLGRDSYDMLKLLSCDDRLRTCFDTNHLFYEDVGEYIHKVGSKLVTTHVSDFDYKNERHWLPGEGKVDWIKLIDALRSVDYEGPWLYELDYKAPETIKRRQLTAMDFKNNYDILMDNKIPQALGTPVEEKCVYWKER